MKALYSEYIAYMTPKWTEASVRSESMRLNKFLHLLDGDPQKLWQALQEIKPYARITYWGRVVSFWEWRIKKKGHPGPNPYGLFREENPRCFRGHYIKKPADTSFDDAMGLILSIRDESVKNKCIQLLTGGLRWAESFTLTQDGYVTGKGGKIRRVYPLTPEGPIAGRDQYSTVLRTLKDLGLRPHKLRSIKMTDMVEKGATSFQLQKFAGWSSIATAESYVHVKDEDVKRLADLSNQKVVEQGLIQKALGWAKRKVG